MTSKVAAVAVAHGLHVSHAYLGSGKPAMLWHKVQQLLKHIMSIA